jgi:hypothetical protein
MTDYYNAYQDGTEAHEVSSSANTYLLERDELAEEVIRIVKKLPC